MTIDEESQARLRATCPDRPRVSDDLDDAIAEVSAVLGPELLKPLSEHLAGLGATVVRLVPEVPGPGWCPSMPCHGRTRARMLASSSGLTSS